MTVPKRATAYVFAPEARMSGLVITPQYTG